MGARNDILYMNIQDSAKEIGFTSVGIVKCRTLNDELFHLKEWIGKNYNGEMKWLERDPSRRTDPAKVLDGCKTVIVSTLKFDDMPLRKNRSSSSSRLNRSSSAEALKRLNAETLKLPKYLQHEDYHKVVMEKLEALTEEIKKEYPNAKFKFYVDTGPVLEKAWGVKAGLGFIGKNTLLISPEHGSQLAIGIILCSEHVENQRTNLPAGRHGAPTCLPAGTAHQRTSCGSCTKCLDACPTKALKAPYILDARLCRSYKFFIEKADGGCDTCQDVCPFNKQEA